MLLSKSPFLTISVFGTVLLTVAAKWAGRYCPLKNEDYNVAFTNGVQMVASPVTCLYSKGSHTVYPLKTLVNFRERIDWSDMDSSFRHIITECGKTAFSRKHRFFAIEYYGECYTGTDLVYGRSVEYKDGCQHCEMGKHNIGGPDHAALYQIH